MEEELKSPWCSQASQTDMGNSLCEQGAEGWPKLLPALLSPQAEPAAHPAAPRTPQSSLPLLEGHVRAQHGCGEGWQHSDRQGQAGTGSATRLHLHQGSRIRVPQQRANIKHLWACATLTWAPKHQSLWVFLLLWESQAPCASPTNPSTG